VHRETNAKNKREAGMNSNAAVDVPSVAQDAPIAGSTRWIQLALGLLCMMAISSPQYVWTLFTKPLMGKLGVTLAELQITFSILIVLQRSSRRCRDSSSSASGPSACYPSALSSPA